MLDLNNPKYYQQRWEQLYGIYQNADRVNRQLQQELQFQKDNPNKDAQGSLKNNQFIQEFLRGQVTGDDPRFNQQRQQIFGDINRTFDRQGLRSKENLAQAGLSRSGLGSVITSLLAGQRANAEANANVNIGNQQQLIKDQAIRNLLGVDAQNLQANLGQQGLNLRESGLNENQRQFNSQMDFRKNQSGFGNVLGRLLGQGVGAFAGGAGSYFGSNWFRPKDEVGSGYKV